MNTNAIIITGPTASGKSDFAHKLAMCINGAIINCDSVQIYAGIENISASPFAGRSVTDDIDGVPYRLFSVFSLDKHISVADYLNLARKAMDEVIAMGKIPIFVGGTGYYINVLLNGIATVPEVSEENRTRAREMVKHNIDSVYKLLPEVVYKDPQRVARALEVFLETGKTLAEWQKIPRQGALVKDAFKILVLPEREVLLTRIAKRIPQMISGGAEEEAKNIIAKNFDETRAIGAMQFCKILRGEASKEEAINDWIIKTNQYAKRQRTWFRGQYDADYEINHIPSDDDLEKVIKELS
ncbi:MAG: tRNA (adenosine(37)-N6)-dimethylallyltransferase MiaA [Alphaproteobacteria bacterium]|nr:tRNA (adenosine(37)-N6)-dimethylallyltransferase MiaA [Alphaproteobacteria bacterium]